MSIPIDRQIESLVDAWEREISRLHLGASPYDDDPDEELPPSPLIITGRD